MIYFDKVFTLKDIEYIWNNATDADKEWMVNYCPEERFIEYSCADSRVIRDNDEIIGIIVKNNNMFKKYTLWKMIFIGDRKKYLFKLLRLTKWWLDRSEKIPYAEVLTTYNKSQRWLEALGFEAVGEFNSNGNTFNMMVRIK